MNSHLLAITKVELATWEHRVKFEFLMTLEAILRRGSFAAAADEVGLSPSAVSLQVKRLEEYLGQQLFDRSSRTARPTAVARELSDSLRGVLEAVEAARTRQSLQVTGRVVLGTIRSLQSTMIPLVLQEISRRHSALSVRVIQGDSTELLTQLNAGDLDGAALIRPGSGGSSRLLWTDLERQPFVFVAPCDTGTATAAELVKRFDWLQFDTSLTSGRVAASYLHRLSPSTKPKFELGGPGGLGHPPAEGRHDRQPSGAPDLARQERAQPPDFLCVPPR
jgi:DNA-binding transcriptional LysR family regulator